MGASVETLLDLVGGNAHRVVLLSALALSVALGWRAWKQTRAPSAYYIWLGAASVLVGLLVWVPFSGLAHLSHVPDRLWVAPFDRLLSVIVLLTLGWTLISPGGGHRGWRRFLVAGFLATVLTYVVWAPLWASSVHAQPLLAADPTGLAQLWDVWLVALAIAVASAVELGAPRAPRWLVAAIGVIALGSLLELVIPLATEFPAWSRLGTLAAGAVFVGAAVTQTLELRARQPSSAEHTAPDRSTARPRDAANVGSTHRRGGPVPEIGLEAGPDVVIERALREMTDELSAAPAVVARLTPAEDLEVWMLAGPLADPRRLGTLPLAEQPTLARALRKGPIHLVIGTRARDIAKLYRLMGLSGGGPVLLQPIRARQAAGATSAAYGVLVAGRSNGSWSERDRVRLRDIAARAAARLNAIETERAAAGQLPRVLSQLEAQADTLSRVTRLIDDLGRRVEALEHGDGPPGPETIVLSPRPKDEAGERGEPDTPTSRPRALTDGGPTSLAPLKTRIARYEQALDRLPWGVVVVDREGHIAFANPSAGRLMHAPTEAGTPLADALPDAERVALALSQVRQRADDEGQPVELNFESPRVRVELEPLLDPALGYLGALALLGHRSAEQSPELSRLLPALAEALRAPMKSILGYSDLMARGAGLTEDQLGRFLQRIDANLARMRVMLSNLLIVMELESPRATFSSQPVDIEQAVGRAIERARAQLDEKGLAINIRVEDGLPPASADPRAVSQIIDNLLVNAALRSPQGGDVTVGLKLRADDGGRRALVISIHDRGSKLETTGVIAIDEGTEPPVAMTVVRMLAEQLGGHAWAESNPIGARFHVRLPLRRRVA